MMAARIAWSIFLLRAVGLFSEIELVYSRSTIILYSHFILPYSGSFQWGLYFQLAHCMSLTTNQSYTNQSYMSHAVFIL